MSMIQVVAQKRQLELMKQKQLQEEEEASEEGGETSGPSKLQPSSSEMLQAPLPPINFLGPRKKIPTASEPKKAAAPKVAQKPKPVEIKPDEWMFRPVEKKPDDE